MITTPLQKSIALCFTLLLFTSISYTQIYVDVDASAGGSGTSWGTAYNSLQTALASASSGDEIWVAQGTYTITGDKNTTFEIPSGVAIYGGFDGTETTRNQRDWDIHITTLDGNNYNHTIVLFYNSSTSTNLDGFVLENGK